MARGRLKGEFQKPLQTERGIGGHQTEARFQDGHAENKYLWIIDYQSKTLLDTSERLETSRSKMGDFAIKEQGKERLYISVRSSAAVNEINTNWRVKIHGLTYDITMMESMPNIAREKYKRFTIERDV